MQPEPRRLWEEREMRSFDPPTLRVRKLKSLMTELQLFHLISSLLIPCAFSLSSFLPSLSSPHPQNMHFNVIPVKIGHLKTHKKEKKRKKQKMPLSLTLTFSVRRLIMRERSGLLRGLQIDWRTGEATLISVIMWMILLPITAIMLCHASEANATWKWSNGAFHACTG